MTTTLLTIFLSAVSLSCNHPAEAIEHYRYRELHEDFRRQRTTTPAPLSANEIRDDADDVQELYFTQRLDHFDPSNTRTYQQRYFVTHRYESSDNNHDPGSAETITFLCVGGEGPGFDKSVLVDSVHCSGDMLAVAERLHNDFDADVRVLALEHRYYGKSYPKFGDESPVTIQNLKYLSSRQALEDLAHFVSYMKSQQRGGKSSHGGNRVNSHDGYDDYDVPWVTFGGSYPGYLAGMARYKYPHLIYAAVSNSAPLHMIVDFPQYQDKVGWDLKYAKIGGSDECFRIVKDGHRQAADMVQLDPAGLANMFHICNPDTVFDVIRNQELLLGDGLIEIPAQGNDPSCDDELCNIAKICDAMIQQTDMTELEILAYIANEQRQSDGNEDDDDDDDDDCVEIDWKGTLEEFSQPTVTDEGWRSWLWQTCTEVGFYQTCMESCPYASFYHMVDMDLEICAVAYNITNVPDNVQATADHYGDLNIAGGSRIISVNGDVDPWSTLAIQESPKQTLPVLMVEGASHHFWTHKIQHTDSREVMQAREIIALTVMFWLGNTPGDGILMVDTDDAHAAMLEKVKPVDDAVMTNQQDDEVLQASRQLLRGGGV